MKFQAVVDLFSKAPSGAFVGITDYVSSDSEVSSITGHLGFSYSTVKAQNIERLKAKIEQGFEPIIVSGNCYHDGKEFNARKRSAPIKPYCITYSPEEVKAVAEKILEGWLNPVERENNKVALTEKENGLAFQTATGNFTFSLLVEKQYYKEEASKAAKAANGVTDDIEIKHPETKLKEEIRGMVERKFRTFTIGEGKFKSISIAGTRIESSDITI